jgi:hypothetical protein
MTSQAKRIAELAEVDAMPADLRAIVWDEGYSAVKGFLQLGIRDAGTIRRAIAYARAALREEARDRIIYGCSTVGKESGR